MNTAIPQQVRIFVTSKPTAMPSLHGKRKSGQANAGAEGETSVVKSEMDTLKGRIIGIHTRDQRLLVRWIPIHAMSVGKKNNAFEIRTWPSCNAIVMKTRFRILQPRLKCSGRAARQHPVPDPRDFNRIALDIASNARTLQVMWISSTRSIDCWLAVKPVDGMTITNITSDSNPDIHVRGINDLTPSCAAKTTINSLPLQPCSCVGPRI
jgi:hypothetical protein